MQADRLIVNGVVLSQVPGADPCEALAIAGDRVLALGSTQEMRALAGPGCEEVDARGGTVLPGFVEAHMHLFPGAAGRRLLQLAEVSGQEALCAALRRYAQESPDEGLLIAKGADYTILGGDEMLTRHHLDNCLPDRPVILIAPDHHTGWANTVALERAGILKGRDVGAGNEIVMGDDGLATGELREGHAMAPVMDLRTSGGRESLGLSGVDPDHAGPGERAEDKEVLRSGLEYCAACGITSIHNMDGNRYQLELLAEIEAEGDLLCRVEVPYHLTNDKPLSMLDEASRLSAEYDSDMLSCGRVKIFADGVLDSGTAVMLDDYADRPGWRGEPLFTPEEFRKAAIDTDARGLQISVHAIGDGAVRLVLDGYEAAQRANGRRDSRHRIEHIEVVHPDDIPRFAELGVIASMQPPHAPGTMGLSLEPTLGKIGRSRWHLAFAWRTLWDAGVRIAFASDWPVSPLEPLHGIEAAVTRPCWADDLPDQSATLDEALAGYTREGAYAGFVEDRLGQLAPGFLADVVVLSGDITACAPDKIQSLRPVLTLCGGRVTHREG